MDHEVVGNGYTRLQEKYLGWEKRVWRAGCVQDEESNLGQGSPYPFASLPISFAHTSSVPPVANGYSQDEETLKTNQAKGM